MEGGRVPVLGGQRTVQSPLSPSTFLPQIQGLSLNQKHGWESASIYNPFLAVPAALWWQVNSQVDTPGLSFSNRLL